MERVVFVCDNFAEKFIGGAELSVQVHIDTCPFPKVLVKSSEFNPKKFNPKKDFLVFGNFANLNREAFAPVMEKFKYVIEECDYKYCLYRSSHKHKAVTGKDCDCHVQEVGKLVFEFMQRAEWVFWKSERQRYEYVRLFGDPIDTWPIKFIGSIMGGVFSDADLDLLVHWRDGFRAGTAFRSNEWFVLYSGSWIKGYSNAAAYCRENGLKMKAVGNIPYRDCLVAMAGCEGIVYLPNGFDVSCRMITEAKVLGLKIITNDKVQHVTEPWFKGTDEERLAFLRSRNPEFWKIVSNLILAVKLS